MNPQKQNQCTVSHSASLSKALFSALSIIALSSSLSATSPHPHYQSALSQVQESETIAVYVYGSDWNKLGGWIKKRIWDNPSFQGALQKVHTVSINHPEHHVKNLNRTLNKFFKEGNEPLTLQQLTSDNSKTQFTKQKNGAYLVTGKAADKESYALDFNFTTPTEILLFDLLSDPNHPNKRAGRSKNGNIAISEIEAETSDGEKIKFTAAYASDAEGDKKAFLAIDGKNTESSCWNANGHKGSPNRQLALVAEKPLKGGVRIIVHFHSWNQHSFGHFKIYGSNNAQLKRSIEQDKELNYQQLNNKNFSIHLKRYPALILTNHKGEKFAHMDDFSIRTRPEQVVKMIEEKQKLYQERQQHWKTAKTSSGKAKIEAIGKGLEVEGLMLEKKLRDEYIKELRGLGTQYDSPTLRLHLFDVKHIQKKVNELVKQNKHKEALKLIHKEATLPVNSRLPSWRIQDIYMMAFHLCREWEGNKDKRYGVLKRIVKIDPKTHLGIGAQGYLMKDGRGPVSLNWGWRPKDIQKGKQTLIIKEGVNNGFYHKGKFRLTLRKGGGKSNVFVEEFSLLSDGKVIATSSERKALHRDIVELNFELNRQQVRSKLSLRVKLDTPGATDHYGKFVIDRFL